MEVLMRLSAIFIVLVSLAACATGVSQDAALSASISTVDTAPELRATPEPETAVVRKDSYSEVHVDGRYVALTFDDGPSKKLTPNLLDTLKQYGAHATFFVVGQNAAEYPEILQRAVAEGHEIANHSWSHPSLSKLSVGGIQSQLDRTDAAIEKAIGRGTKLVRPPYGASNATVRKTLADRGETVVLWSVDPLDWKYRNAERVERALVQGAAPGAILLAHDIHASTVAAIPGTLAALIDQGYKFVTVSELLAMETRPAPTPAPIPQATAAPEPQPVASVTSAAPAPAAMAASAEAVPQMGISVPASSVSPSAPASVR